MNPTRMFMTVKGLFNLCRHIFRGCLRRQGLAGILPALQLFILFLAAFSKATECPQYWSGTEGQYKDFFSRPGAVFVVNNSGVGLYNVTLASGNTYAATPSTLEPGQYGVVQDAFPTGRMKKIGGSPGIFVWWNGPYVFHGSGTTNHSLGYIPTINTIGPWYGCGGSGVVYFGDINIDDASDMNKVPDCPQGMPLWQVSEPYESVWLHDEPLGYQPATGPRLAFQLSYKQRESEAGLNPALFSVGKKWNFSWLSYVRMNGSGYPVVCFPGGGQRAFFGATDYLTNTRLSGDATNGFTVSYPDGRQDVYSFVVTNSSGAFQMAMLTEQWDPQARKTRFGYSDYDNQALVIRLSHVVDADGGTNFISYCTNDYSANLISQVVDRFGRTSTLKYDPAGRLTNITDVAGLSSSFAYDDQDWVTNMTTPYGSSSFSITNITGSPVAVDGRSVLVTEPDGGKQLFLCKDSAPGVDSSSSQVPDTAPFANTLDNSDLHLRNTFHWSKRQYAALSTGDITALTAADYRKARMLHWLKPAGALIGETLSIERAPSQDAAGSVAGQITWFDYAGKTNSQCEGTLSEPLFSATVLPDGNTRFIRTDRNDLGLPLSDISTYTAGSTVALRTNSFGYATNGIDLVAVTNALGVRVLAATYNGYHQPLAGWNALDEQTSFTYNTNQQVTSISRPGGLVTTNIFLTSADSLNRLRWAIDYSITDGAPLYLRTNSYTWANGLPATHTDPRGLTVAFTRDNLQRLTRLDFPDGTFITNTFNKLDLVQTVDRMGFINSFEFNSVRQMTRRVDARGVVTLMEYCSCGSLETLTNAAGTPQQQVIRYYYDNQGNQTQLVGPDNYSVTWQLDSLGRATNVFDAVSAVTNYYNNQGLLVSQRNAAGQIEARAYDILDRPTNIVNANGVAVSQSFDDLYRLVSRSYPDAGIERFAYSPLGLVAYTNQLNHVTRYGLDVFGRQIAETNANLGVIRATYSPGGDRLSLTDANNHTTTWTHSIHGRPISKRDANNTEIFRWSYDANNRLTNQWTAEKGGIGYSLDPNGNRLAILYPQSSILFWFDPLNRLTNMVDAVGVTRYSYTAAGLLETEDGPWDNDTVAYSHQNRLRVGLSLAQPNTSAWSQTYGYDAAKRLTSLTSPAGEFVYNYDPLRQFKVGRISLPNSAHIDNSFDDAARLTGTYLKNSGGKVLDGYTYAYNQAGLRTNIIRSIAGSLSSLALANDPVGQLISASGSESNGVPRLHEQYGFIFDPAENLRLRTNNGLVQEFAVNNLNELTTVSRTESSTLTVAGLTTGRATNITVNGQPAAIYADRTFAKDGFSLVDGTNTFTVIAQSARGARDTNTISSLLPASVLLVYDLNGNLRTNGNQVFEYDDENKLVSATIPGVLKKEMVYDGLNRLRIKRDYAWIGGGWTLTNETRFVYDGVLPIQHRDANNMPILTLTRGLDLSGTLQGAGGIGGLLAMSESSGTHSYYHSDGNGNVTCLINANQLIVGSAIFDPFGRFLGISGPKANVNRYWFSSELYDAELGLYHYPRRVYAPTPGRWLTRDPIGEAGGANLYQFVGNAPISRADPLGLLDYYYSTGTFLQPSGPVPYLSAETAAGSFGAGIYNAIPFVYNSLFGGLLNIGTKEGSISGQGGGTTAMTAAVVSDTLAASVVVPFAMEGIALSRCAAARLAEQLAAEGGGAQTFEIIEGVRRAKANQLLGNQSIPAQIFNAEGKLVGEQNIAIDALRSPSKSVIDMSTQAQVDRYMSIQRGLQQGDKIPPIVVTPGGRGVPIQDIIFDAVGGAR